MEIRALRPERDTRLEQAVRPILHLVTCLIALLLAPGAWGQIMDSDADGLEDPWDNCSQTYNPAQLDQDEDGFGDRCDADFDNDGIVAGSDFTYFTERFGLGGAAAEGADLDGSGSVAGNDFVLFMDLFGREPGPGALAPPEEAGSIAGIVREGWIRGPSGGDQAVVFEDVEGVAFYEGDIILGSTEALMQGPADSDSSSSSSSSGGIGSVTQSGVVVRGSQYRWPGGVIPFTFDVELSETMRARALEAIAHWESYTQVEFVERTAVNDHEFPDWVHFQPVDRGCSAHIGRAGIGRQSVNLATACSLGNVIHEIGHSVGFWHHQAKSNRDDYVEILWENIEPGADGICGTGDPGDRCSQFEKHEDDGDDIDQWYDYESIMHYPRWAFSRNGLDTIRPLDPDAVIGQRQGLSEGDVSAANALLGVSEWRISSAGTHRYERLNNASSTLATIRFGDFDGDGRTDVFETIGGTWYVSDGGESRYRPVNTSSNTIDELRFADFDGDGRTDVFYRSPAGEWLVSYGATGRYQLINTASETIDQLRFGDFDGDGRADVFTVGDGEWKVSYGGTGRYRVINTSNQIIDQLGFADFNGDGRTDVFSKVDTGDWGVGEWLVSYGGTSRYRTLNSMSTAVHRLRIGDFDGDGRDDVFTTSSNGQWLVSFAGSTPWTVINEASESLEELVLGDFTGDGRADVFMATGERAPL